MLSKPYFPPFSRLEGPRAKDRAAYVWFEILIGWSRSFYFCTDLLYR